MKKRNADFYRPTENILHGSAGFTLIETIISLVLFAILSTIIFTFMSSSLVNSHKPVLMAQNLAQTQEDVEETVAGYDNYLEGDIIWPDLKDQLPDTCMEIQGEGGFSSDFEILECMFNVEGQRVSVLFTEVN